jgi:hypothetical protein
MIIVYSAGRKLKCDGGRPICGNYKKHLQNIDESGSPPPPGSGKARSRSPCAFDALSLPREPPKHKQLRLNADAEPSGSQFRVTAEAGILPPSLAVGTGGGGGGGSGGTAAESEGSSAGGRGGVHVSSIASLDHLPETPSKDELRDRLEQYVRFAPWLKDNKLEPAVGTEDVPPWATQLAMEGRSIYECLVDTTREKGATIYRCASRGCNFRSQKLRRVVGHQRKKRGHRPFECKVHPGWYVMAPSM